MPEEWTGRLIGRMHNERVTVEEIANELGITKAYVSMILNSRRNPPNARDKLEAAFARVCEKREHG